jgi:hypothetical protein
MDKYRASMTEAQILKALKDYAGVEGGYCFHVVDSRMQDTTGMPDTLILIPRSYAHPGIVGLFEIKTQYDRVSRLQEKVLQVAGAAQEIVAGIIRPNPKALNEYTLDEALELLGKETWHD